MAALPQRPNGGGWHAVKQCGGERLGCELSGVGKKARGGGQSSFYRSSVRRGHKESLVGFHCVRYL
jgi:hypothetical protein